MSSRIAELLQQLRQKLSEKDHVLIDELELEIKAQRYNTHASQDAKSLSSPAFNPKTGCYEKEGSVNQYCPSCYDSQQRLHQTQRINSRLRVCTVCRTSIKPTASPKH